MVTEIDDELDSFREPFSHTFHTHFTPSRFPSPPPHHSEHTAQSVYPPVPDALLKSMQCLGWYLLGGERCTYLQLHAYHNSVSVGFVYALTTSTLPYCMESSEYCTVLYQYLASSCLCFSCLFSGILLGPFQHFRTHRAVPDHSRSPSAILAGLSCFWNDCNNWLYWFTGGYTEMVTGLHLSVRSIPSVFPPRPVCSHASCSVRPPSRLHAILNLSTISERRSFVRSECSFFFPSLLLLFLISIGINARGWHTRRHFSGMLCWL